MSAGFEKATEMLKDKILDACNPDGWADGLTNEQYMSAMGATLVELLRLNVSFFAQHDEKLARELLDGIEADLSELRVEHGWFDDK